ncbi:MAG: GNAT family N-acetyltransferase [Anaerolineae bacterium]|nr:GNAT family N-acetyltransferase [Anaerolineae bacterium]
MKIIDLTPEYESTFLLCLKDWTAEQEMQAGRQRKRAWYAMMKDKGLRVKLALNDDGQAIGMIQYLPVAYARVEGKDLYFIQCIWVHGYDEGMGNMQGYGAGTMLLQAAENDAKALGAKGMVAWGLIYPHWMPAAWYEKHGYIEANRLPYDKLVWKPFIGDAEAPRWLRPRKTPDPIPGKVVVTAFITHWCPGLSKMSDAQRAAAEFGDRVIFREIDTSDPSVLHEWGIESALYIDDECINAGLTDYPPPSYEDIKQRIQHHLERIR